MKLVTPSTEFEKSFIEAANDITKEGQANFLKAFSTTNDFQSYCDKLNDEAKGVGLEEGMVSASTFWLIDNNNFIGRVAIRHSLNENLLKVGGHIGYIIAPKYRRQGYGTKILELSLVEATALGLKKVLVTCNKTNIASAKIIEKNGGVFENELYNEETAVWKRRYWITT